MHVRHAGFVGDLVVIVSTFPLAQCDTLLASAGALAVEDDFNRPIVGEVIFCTVDPADFNFDLTTAVHETMHILARRPRLPSSWAVLCVLCTLCVRCVLCMLCTSIRYAAAAASHAAMLCRGSTVWLRIPLAPALAPGRPHAASLAWCTGDGATGRPPPWQVPQRFRFDGVLRQVFTMLDCPLSDLSVERQP